MSNSSKNKGLWTQEKYLRGGSPYASEYFMYFGVLVLAVLAALSLYQEDYPRISYEAVVSDKVVYPNSHYAVKVNAPIIGIKDRSIYIDYALWMTIKHGDNITVSTTKRGLKSRIEAVRSPAPE